MGNDTIGGCKCAAAGHLIEEWTANLSATVVPPDNPVTHANDSGTAELDVLNYWRRTGVDHHKMEAFVALEPENNDHIRDSVLLFGGVHIGLALPVSAQTQSVWTAPLGGPSGQGALGWWGGHAVPVVAYDNRTLTCVTGGQLKMMTWSLWQTYCDEAYAIPSPYWINSKNFAPNNVNPTTLRAEL